VKRRKRTRATTVTQMAELGGYLAEGKPVLIDLWQSGCQPCRMMEGIVDELADEFVGRAHVLKIDVGRVPGAVQAFRVQSTPTFVVLGRSPKPMSKKARTRSPGPRSAAAPAPGLNPRWRASGLVRKDVLAGVLRSNGADGDR